MSETPPAFPRPGASDGTADPAPPTPDLYRAQLDVETLRQLFADVAEYGDAVVATARSAPGGRPEALGLEEALARLERRETSIQLRYWYDGDEWCDTLRCGAGAVELVRVRYPS